MPYRNVPDDLQDKMESCVNDLKGQGKDEESAISICYASVVEGKAAGDTPNATPAHGPGGLMSMPGQGKPKKKKAAGESLGQQLMRISGGFEKQFSTPGQFNAWAVEVYPDYVIGCFYDSSSAGTASYFKVPYTLDANGDPTFAMRDEWIIVEREERWVEKTKARVKEQTQTLATKVFEAILRSLKAGARHSKADAEDMQTLHDIAVRQGAMCPTEKVGFFVKKQADGSYRWTLLSSSSFEDRDKEVVSQKALVKDVARADKDGDYGPLFWWHLPEAELGTTDFNAMEGRVLVESGLFHNKQVGEKVAEHADELGVSIGFYHPESEPDADGVFHNIRRFERSLLPLDVASNTLTAVPLVVKETSMDDKKKERLLELLGGDEALVNSVIKQAETAEKQAEQQGVRFKEAQAQAEAAKAGEPPAKPAAKPEDEPDGDELEATIQKMIDAKMAGMAEGLNELKALLGGRKKEADEAADDVESTGRNESVDE